MRAAYLEKEGQVSHSFTISFEAYLHLRRFVNSSIFFWMDVKTSVQLRFLSLFLILSLKYCLGLKSRSRVVSCVACVWFKRTRELRRPDQGLTGRTRRRWILSVCVYEWVCEDCGSKVMRARRKLPSGFHQQLQYELYYYLKQNLYCIEWKKLFFLFVMHAWVC